MTDITKENNFDLDVGDFGTISKSTLDYLEYLNRYNKLSTSDNKELKLLIPAKSKEMKEVERQLIFVNNIIKKSTEGNKLDQYNAMNLYRNLVSKTGKSEPIEIAKALAKFKLDTEQYDLDKEMVKTASDINDDDEFDAVESYHNRIRETSHKTETKKDGGSSSA
jgi:hypothetical protein